MNIWEKMPNYYTCLAPMEGVTDIVFRSVVNKAGRPDLFFTEFTNVTSFASEKGRHDALERLAISKTDQPIVAQIWGKNPEHFANLAAHIEELGFQGIDLNMGCPDRHVNKAGGGAAMIKTPELAVECIRMAKANSHLPISVKTRLGFTYIDEYKTWLPTILNEHPANLTVHLRTRKEMSKVPAHFELIPEIIKLRDDISPETKLTINGDIKDRRMCEELHKKYPKVNGFMIGRGIFENPFCFTDYEPTREDLIKLFYFHLDQFDEHKKVQENYPYEPLKHFFKIYVKGFDGASDLRVKLMDCKSTAELRDVLKTVVL